MTELAVTIAHDQFEQAGFMPTYDAEKYHALIDSLATPEQIEQKPPILRLAPWQPLLAKTKLGAVWKVLKRDSRTYGEYDPKTSEMSVFIMDENQANSTLLHEARHWADDATGMHQDNRTQAKETLRRILPYYIGATVIDLCAAAGCAFIPNPELKYGTLTAVLLGTTLGIISVNHRIGYEKSSWEQRAQAFQTNTDTVKQFGGIISLKKVA